jgi:hypothetical protein
MWKQPLKNARTIRLCSNPMDPKKKPRRHSGRYEEDERWLKWFEIDTNGALTSNAYIYIYIYIYMYIYIERETTI